MGFITPHLEILPVEQKRLWPELKASIVLGFVLYGGTAVALRLGHRFSVDFDLFSEKPLDHNAIWSAFPFMPQALVLQDQPNALSVLAPTENGKKEYVKVSFYGTIGFGRVGEPDATHDNVLQIASLDDLMATKVKVILQRIEAKDYRDIAAMLKANVDLAKALSAARALYGVSFQPSESLKAMTYFKGGDLHSLTKEEKNILIRAVSAVRDLPQVTVLSRQLSAQGR